MTEARAGKLENPKVSGFELTVASLQGYKEKPKKSHSI